ncbi:MAG: single-stranded DNA-binding protein [Clostridiales bacterium]|jgi:single-strand DNA-binding protein|nr:single-stranded DNA-binding protein [Clostridiales bacterium]
MNKVILIGRLTKDPEIRYGQGNEPMAIARYTVAIDRRFKRDGEPTADFIPCVAFGKAGEFIEKFFKKGMMICVTGRIQVRSWDDQSGTKHWSTEVIAEEQEFVESKAAFQARSEGSGQYANSNANYPTSQDSLPSGEPEGFSAISESIDDEDLPF